MALARLPESTSFSTTTVALVALGYVLTAIAPHARKAQELQRAWNGAKTAALAAQKRVEYLPEAVAAVRALNFENLSPEDSVLRLKRARVTVVDFVKALRDASSSMTILRSRLTELRRFRHLLRGAKFDEMWRTFEEQLPMLDEFDQAVATINPAAYLANIDHAVEVAIDETTNAVLAKVLDPSRERRKVSAEEALSALKDIHDFASENGLKLGA